jgi:hypothetical protein
MLGLLKLLFLQRSDHLVARREWPLQNVETAPTGNQFMEQILSYILSSHVLVTFVHFIHLSQHLYMS